MTRIIRMIVGLVCASHRLVRPAGPMARLALGAAVDLTRTRSELLAENALLRQQVIVLRRNISRPQLRCQDRLLLLLLARLTRRWRDAVHLVSPDTVLRWHRDLFKIVWCRRSRRRGQPRRLASEIISLIQRMARDNVLWGAERIRGELLKLGIHVSKRTIQKYMREVRPPGRRGQAWAAFLRNHRADIWACDFLQLYDLLFRPIFALFFVVHETREVVHFNVTRWPIDAWTAHQLREATPHCEGSRYLIRDNDSKSSNRFAAVAQGRCIEAVTIPPRSPNLNPICERFLGSVPRECLDHVLILSERHLRRVLREYVETYFKSARPHRGLSQRTPVLGRSRTPAPVQGKVIAFPVLGGLHHDYRLAA